MSTDPVLHVFFNADCTVAASAGRGTLYKQVGLALDGVQGLCIAASHGDKKLAIFPATAVQRVHAKFLDSGKLTFEVGAGKQGAKQLLISKAQSKDLKVMLGALDEAAKRAAQRGQKQASQEECVAILQQRYPDQVRKQLDKIRKAQGSDAPQPMKGHTRLMVRKGRPISCRALCHFFSERAPLPHGDRSWWWTPRARTSPRRARCCASSPRSSS